MWQNSGKYACNQTITSMKDPSALINLYIAGTMIDAMQIPAISQPTNSPHQGYGLEGLGP